MIDICIGIAGPLVVFAFILSSLCSATPRSGVLVGRGMRTLAKRIVICGRLYQLMLLLILPFYRTTVSAAVAAISHPPLGPMEQLYRSMLSLWSTAAAVVSPPVHRWMHSLWSTVAAVWAATPLPLRIYFSVIIGSMLLLSICPSLAGSQGEPFPRRFRRAQDGTTRSSSRDCWFGGDAGVLAAKRGEKSGSFIGGGSVEAGGGGASELPTILLVLRWLHFILLGLVLPSILLVLRGLPVILLGLGFQASFPFLKSFISSFSALYTALTSEARSGILDLCLGLGLGLGLALFSIISFLWPVSTSDAGSGSGEANTNNGNITASVGDDDGAYSTDTNTSAAAGSKYQEGDSAYYCKNGEKKKVKIKKVHYDDDRVPFFVVSLPCGREIQTIDGYLEPFADANAAPQAAPRRFLVVHHRGDKVKIPYEISDCGSDVRRKIENALGFSVAMKHIKVAGKTLGDEDLYENIGDLGIAELSTITVLTGTFGRGGQKSPSRASDGAVDDTSTSHSCAEVGSSGENLDDDGGGKPSSLELAKVAKLRGIVGVAPEDDQDSIADYVNSHPFPSNNADVDGMSDDDVIRRFFTYAAHCMQVFGGYHLRGLLEHLDDELTVGPLLCLLADFPSVLLMRRILTSNGNPHEITKEQWEDINGELLETHRLDPNEPGGIYIRLFFRTAGEWRAEFDEFMEKSKDGRYKGQNVRKLRILISKWLKKYAGIDEGMPLSIMYIGQTIRTVAERMDEENNPNVLDGAIANALFTRFFGKKDGEKHTPDLSIKVGSTCIDRREAEMREALFAALLSGFSIVDGRRTQKQMLSIHDGSGLNDIRAGKAPFGSFKDEDSFTGNKVVDALVRLVSNGLGNESVLTTGFVSHLPRQAAHSMKAMIEGRDWHERVPGFKKKKRQVFFKVDENFTVSQFLTVFATLGGETTGGYIADISAFVKEFPKEDLSKYFSPEAINAYNGLVQAREIRAQFGNRGDIGIAEYREMAAERGLTSLFLGVSKQKSGYIVSFIRHHYENIYIGTFPTEADAARAYDIFAKAIKTPSWVCNFATPEDYEVFRKLEASGSPAKGLFNEVTKKAEFFKEALARGESASAARVAWRPPRMDVLQPGETWADSEQRLQAIRDEHGRNPLFALEACLELYKAFKRQHPREPKEVGKLLDTSKRPLEFFLAKWAATQKLRSKVGASGRLPPERRALLRAAGIPNIPGDGIARRVAVTVVGGGIPSGEAMDADVVATAGNDGVGSEEGVETSAAAAEPDESFRRGSSYSQDRSKRRRISRPAPQQKEDAMITSAAVESPWLQWLEDDEEASRAAQSADAAFGPLEVDVDAPPVAPDDGNDYHCSKCKLFGDLICCDMCPKTYHRGCLPSGSSLESVDNDGDWFCPACLAISAIPSSIPVVSTDEEMGDTDSDATIFGDSITGSTADLDDD